MNQSTEVLIIGAGISGLSLAWWLAQQGVQVEIWEADSRIGGKIQTNHQDGYVTEQAAAMLMNFRPEVTELVQHSGLENLKTPRSAEAETKRYLIHRGQLTALPMQLGAVVRSPLWSLRGKLRLLAEPFIPPLYRQDESVSQFIKRRLGKEMLEKAIEPFIAGTLASDPDHASAQACLPRLTALERRYGSITAGIIANRILRKRTACETETFSFKGGMQTLIESLARTPGVQIATGYRVTEIYRQNKDWCVHAETPYGPRSVTAPQVVMTTPAPKAAALVSHLDKELATLLKEICYAPVNVVHMGFDRHAIDHALDGTGFLVPRSETTSTTRALTGNLWMSTLFPNRAPQGKVLLSSYVGGARMPGVRDWDTEYCMSQTLASLATFLNLKADPEFVRVNRHAQALPLYHGPHHARIQAIANRLQQLPGLHLEANYRGGVSVRDRIARSQTVAEQILAVLPKTDMASSFAAPTLRPNR